MGILQQIQEINPSAKSPFFRRIIGDPKLAYLRNGNTITGFEVDLRVDQMLSGLALIGIQKHTIYAYRSDLHEDPKLILFPDAEALRDAAFELSKLYVSRMVFENHSFVGRDGRVGILGELADDLINKQALEQQEMPKVEEKPQEVVAPVVEPKVEKVQEPVVEEVVEEPIEVEVPDASVEGLESYNDFDEYQEFSEGFDEDLSYMDNGMEFQDSFEEPAMEFVDFDDSVSGEPVQEVVEPKVEEVVEVKPVEKPKVSLPKTPSKPMMETMRKIASEPKKPEVKRVYRSLNQTYDSYDDCGSYEDYLKDITPKEDPRVRELRKQKFTKLSEVENFMLNDLHVHKEHVNKLMDVTIKNFSNPEQRVAVCIEMFARCCKRGDIPS